MRNLEHPDYQTKDDFDSLFENQIDDVLADNDPEKYVEQNHYGDFLIEETSEGDERFKLWKNHPENVSQGEPSVVVEYCGMRNRYTWQTIAEFNF